MTIRLAIVALVVWTGSASRADEPVSFTRDVRPILSRNCYACHGPDEQAREANLRLDLRTDAIKNREGSVAIQPGAPAKSELIERITTDDSDLQMPPTETKLSLTPEEKEILRRWIAQGAKYERHWAFVPPQQGSLPSVNNSVWPRNPLDRFVLARLETEKLSPSPAADLHTLLRRVSLDLTGLPPSPEVVDQVLADPSPDAYERYVDSLITSPAYGERWARRWLDLARYSDTNGYEKDRARSIWPYRDWVINAMNHDLPYDQFTIEQLAGDLLPNPTQDQIIATGFHRNTMINEEGGVDVEEFRFESIVDRVNTTGTVWLGLTIGCAQCHTHKFDPITQTEYYRLFAFLNNVDEPEIAISTPEMTRQRRPLLQQIEKLERELKNVFVEETEGDTKTALNERYQQWQEEARKTATLWEVLQPTKLHSARHATLSVLPDQSVLACGDIPNNDVTTIETSAPALQTITALRLELLTHESLPDGGPGRAVFDSGAGAKGDFLLTNVEFRLVTGDATFDQGPNLEFASATETRSLNKSKTAAAAIDDSGDTGWSLGKAGVGQSHQAVFVLKTPLQVSADTRLVFRLEQQFIHQMTLGRFRLSVTDAENAKASQLPAEVEAALLTDSDSRTPAQKQWLRQHYLQTAPEFATNREAIARLRKQLPASPTTMVIQERLPQHARITRLHHRGEFLSPRQIVSVGVPEVLPALEKQTTPNRLALARWLVSDDHPLTARVAVNRMWEVFFGIGLVKTSDDFGMQGEPPSHPELLDWLAVEFRRQNWSRKVMHRLIVTSATYRQSSHVTPELLKRDPENRLLARGSRFRLEAEILRDLMLASSGSITHRTGGPSVFPPQPAGVIELAYGNAKWPTDQGPNRYRRGLYTHSKRTAPYATLTLLGAPSGETCVVRRARSNTPLQALTLLNDTVVLESSQALASRVLRELPNATATQHIHRMFRLILTRPPTEPEQAALTQFAATQRQRIKNGEISPKSLLGEAALKQSRLDPASWAVTTLVARVLYNLEETLTHE